MSRISYGLQMYRLRKGLPEVFLVHPGGPLWAGKDSGSWSIPKGLPEGAEDPLSTARREFEEETGFQASGSFIPLTPVKLKSGKVVQAWTFEGDCDPEAARSNTFCVEWPPNSGRHQVFPEIDRAAWFGIQDAKNNISAGQIGLIEELFRLLKGAGQ